MRVEEIIGDYTNFLARVFKNIDSVGIEIKGCKFDHIAYRAISNKSYDSISRLLGGYGKRISHNIIRNRPVDIYLLDRPLKYQSSEIKYFEVLAPAEGDKFSEGLEHAEFVINMDLHSFVGRYPDLEWNINGIDREIGPEVAIYFPDRANVKFKTMSMDEIVRLEKRKNVNPTVF